MDPEGEYLPIPPLIGKFLKGGPPFPQSVSELEWSDFPINAVIGGVHVKGYFPVRFDHPSTTHQGCIFRVTVRCHY